MFNLLLLLFGNKKKFTYFRFIKIQKKYFIKKIKFIKTSVISVSF